MWFEDFDKIFELQKKRFDNIFSELRDTPNSYGYVLKVGSDGIPRITEFGNKPELTNKPDTNFDEIVDKDTIKYVLEMVGLEKEDIKIDIVENTITINAERGSRKYSETIPLKYKVYGKPKATYKNGILEIIFKKYQPKSQKVDIE